MRNASLILLLSIILSAPVSSFAAVTINSIGGAFSAQDTSSGFTVYAGVSGTDCSAGATIDSACNNCAGKGVDDVCNANYVAPTARLLVNFTSDKGGTINVKIPDGSTIFPQPGSTTSVGPKGTGTVYLKWSDICGQLYGFYDCLPTTAPYLAQGKAIHIDDSTTDAAVSINITLQKYAAVAGGEPPCATADEAACDFSLFPGDEKIYVTGVSGADASYPSRASGLAFQALRLFYAIDPTTATNCSGVTLSSIKYDSPSVDVGVTAGPPIATTSSFLSNFHNDTNYCFIAASIDKAMNVGFLTQTLKYVRPAEVFGILTKENNCFIATAAYGSALDPHVQTFREFRGKYLMTHEWGRKFVRWYYQNAPYWAHEIEHDEQVKAQVRFFLWPLYLLARLMLVLSPSKAIVFLLVLVAGTLGIVNRKRFT